MYFRHPTNFRVSKLHNYDPLFFPIQHRYILIYVIFFRNLRLSNLEGPEGRLKTLSSIVTQLVKEERIHVTYSWGQFFQRQYQLVISAQATVYVTAKWLPSKKFHLDFINKIASCPRCDIIKCKNYDYEMDTHNRIFNQPNNSEVLMVLLGMYRK